jgi:hypothetical protein
MARRIPLDYEDLFSKDALMTISKTIIKEAAAVPDDPPFVIGGEIQFEHDEYEKFRKIWIEQNLGIRERLTALDIVNEPQLLVAILKYG